MASKQLEEMKNRDYSSFGYKDVAKVVAEKDSRIRELEEALKNLRSLCKACIKEPEQYPSYRKAKQLLNK